MLDLMVMLWVHGSLLRSPCRQGKTVYMVVDDVVPENSIYRIWTTSMMLRILETHPVDRLIC